MAHVVSTKTSCAPNQLENTHAMDNKADKAWLCEQQTVRGRPTFDCIAPQVKVLGGLSGQGRHHWQQPQCLPAAMTAAAVPKARLVNVTAWHKQQIT
jgi:hypothetical protein